MPTILNRRDMLKATTLMGAGLYLGTNAESARAADSPNEKLNVAVIGIGGQGGGQPEAA